MKVIMDHCAGSEYICFNGVRAQANRVATPEDAESLYSGHASPKGNRIIAESLEQFLKERKIAYR